jgi:hypothetical protein
VKHRHYTEWMSHLKRPDWLVKGAIQQQGWETLSPADVRLWMTEDQYEAALAQVRIHSAGKPVLTAQELAPTKWTPPTEGERIEWVEQRRADFLLGKIRWNDWNLDKHLIELIAQWQRTRNIAHVKSVLRERCLGRDKDHKCSACNIQRALRNALVNHYQPLPKNLHGEEWQALEKRVHHELGQGSQFARLIVDALRVERNKIEHPPWEWEDAYRGSDADGGGRMKTINHEADHTHRFVCIGAHVLHAGHAKQRGQCVPLREVRRIFQCEVQGCEAFRVSINRHEVPELIGRKPKQPRSIRHRQHAPRPFRKAAIAIWPADPKNEAVSEIANLLTAAYANQPGIKINACRIAQSTGGMLGIAFDVQLAHDEVAVFLLNGGQFGPPLYPERSNPLLTSSIAACLRRDP